MLAEMKSILKRSKYTIWAEMGPQQLLGFEAIIQQILSRSIGRRRIESGLIFLVTFSIKGKSD